MYYQLPILISNILSQFFPVIKHIPDFLLYAIPFNTSRSMCGVTLSRSYERSSTASIVPVFGSIVPTMLVIKKFAYILPFTHSICSCNYACVRRNVDVADSIKFIRIDGIYHFTFSNCSILHISIKEIKQSKSRNSD